MNTRRTLRKDVRIMQNNKNNTEHAEMLEKLHKKYADKKGTLGIVKIVQKTR